MKMRMQHNEYDRYGRLSAANIGLTADASANFSTEYGYDPNSNMTSLRRYGITDRVGDSFVYGLHSEATMAYDGNQRTGITQQYHGETYEGAAGITKSGDYSLNYDSRGNLDSDDSRGIKHTIYNHLNKPTWVIFNNGDTLKIRYDGLGNVVERKFIEIKKMIIGGASAPSVSITPSVRNMRSRTDNFYGPYERTYVDKLSNKYSKVNFAGGYIDVDGKTYYYIHDYQGNVVAVMRGDGTVVQTAEYYPYGEPWLEPEGNNRRLFTGKERLRNIKWYDYGARMSNAAYGDWTGIDPKASDYPWLSPYSFCAADPVNFVDLEGRDIAVLMAGIHTAMLVGNDNDGWRYYSKNGDKIYESTDKYWGGKDHDNLGSIIFGSVQEFLDSNFNQEGTNDDKENDITAGFHYTKAYEIETTVHQDNLAKEAFQKASEAGYHFIGRNCGDAVYDALSAAGLKIQRKSYGEWFSLPLLYSLSLGNLNFKLQADMYSLYMKTTVPWHIYDRLKNAYPSGVERTTWFKIDYLRQTMNPVRHGLIPY